MILQLICPCSSVDNPTVDVLISSIPYFNIIVLEKNQSYLVFMPGLLILYNEKKFLQKTLWFFTVWICNFQFYMEKLSTIPPIYRNQMETPYKKCEVLNMLYFLFIFSSRWRKSKITKHYQERKNWLIVS